MTGLEPASQRVEFRTLCSTDWAIATSNLMVIEVLKVNDVKVNTNNLWLKTWGGQHFGVQYPGGQNPIVITMRVNSSTEL